MNAAERTQWVTERAQELGFDLCGVAPASDFEELARLPEWLARGYPGEMRYLQDARRQSPSGVLPGARSIVVCALNYNTPHPYSTQARVAPAFRPAGFVAERAAAPNPKFPVSSVAPATQATSHESPVTNHGPRGWISRYAWGDDYHHVLSEKLERLVAAMRGEFREPFEARAYVDTGPVVERVAAKYAGLGWLGKNTCLINEHLGSWLFLGVILTTLELRPSLYDELGESAAPRRAGNGSPKSEVSGQMSDVGLPTSDLRLQAASHSPLATHHLLPPPDLCGNCTQCIDACPTGAIVEPYVLEARRCISYLTIELRGPIPEEFRAAMGWHVFGCDICQDVCPYNRHSVGTDAPQFQPRRITQENGKGKMESGAPELSQLPETSHSPLATGHSSGSLFAPQLKWLASLSEEEFRRIFSGSAVKRTKWRGLVRNACVALGNACSAGLQASTSESAQIIALLEKLVHAPDAVIADAARGALDRVQAAAAKS